MLYLDVSAVGGYKGSAHMIETVAVVKSGLKTEGISHVAVENAHAVFVLMAEKHSLGTHPSGHVVKGMVGVEGNGVLKIVHGAEIAVAVLFELGVLSAVALDKQLAHSARSNVEKRKRGNILIAVMVFHVIDRLFIPLARVGKNSFLLSYKLKIGVVGHYAVSPGSRIVENSAAVGVEHHEKAFNTVLKGDGNAEIAVSRDVSSCKDTVFRLFKLLALSSYALGAFVVMIAENRNPRNAVFFTFPYKS